MMTRDEFLNELEYADDVLYPGKFSPYARNIAAHDQAQRAVIEQLENKLQGYRNESLDDMVIRQSAKIEQQAKEIGKLKSDVFLAQEAYEMTLQLEKKQEEKNQALREALQVWQSLFRQAVSVANGLTNYVGDRPGLHDAERSLERLEQQAQQALKEVS